MKLYKHYFCVHIEKFSRLFGMFINISSFDIHVLFLVMKK